MADHFKLFKKRQDSYIRRKGNDLCAWHDCQKRKRNKRICKTPFYRVVSSLDLNENKFEGEWRAVEGSKYFASPKLYKENGFKQKEDAENLIKELSLNEPLTAVADKYRTKKRKEKPTIII